MTEVLTQMDANIQTFSLAEMKLAHCIGCFDCWLKTPGVCVYGEAGAEAILRAYVQSDMVVFITPILFGGYSSQMKQMIDRFVSLILPYIDMYHGETHHKPRYAKYPRLVVVGVQGRRDTEEARLFKLLVGRNALNFHSPSYAVEVVGSSDRSEELRKTFQSLLTRQDAFPTIESTRSIFPSGDASTVLSAGGGTRRACLIIGSPKTRSHSTSAVLGARILGRLKLGGWETESITLGPSLQMEEGQRALLAAVDRADLLILAFPLYVDALPFLATKALELMSDHRLRRPLGRPQGLVAIANNGFIESYQNNVALSICHRFAKESGMTWMGCLAMGAGEALAGGKLSETKSDLGLPTAHVIRALNMAGDALALGRAVPCDAAVEIARSPIPHTPFAIWRLVYVRGSGRMWEQRAARNGLSKRELLAQPYAMTRDKWGGS
jgi:multimeric flavodoxin WrbA